MADQTASIEVLLQNGAKTVNDLKKIEAAIASLQKQLSPQGGARKPVLLQPGAVEQARQQLENITRTSRQARRSFSALADTGRELRDSINKVGVAVGAVAFGLLARQAARFVRSAVEVKREFDGIEQTLKAVTETTEEYNTAQGLVLETSRRLGLSVRSLAFDYANFLASAKPLALSQHELEEAFVAVSEAGRVLNLSQQRLQLTFLALSQIASKGIATMEELRRQLGDQLPGVFPRVAKAMNLTTRELIDQIRQGNILAEDVIPAITKAAQDLAGGQVLEATQTLAARLQRLRLEAELFQKSFAEAAEEGIGKFADEAARLLREGDVSQVLGQIASSAGETAAEVAKAANGWSKLLLLLQEASQRNEGAAESQKTLNEVLVQSVPGIGAVIKAYQDYGDVADETLPGVNEGMVQLADTWLAVQEVAEEAADSQEDVQEELKLTGEAYARAAGEIDETGQRIVAGIIQLRAKLKRIREEAAGDAADAGRQALDDFLFELQRVTQAVKEEYAEQVDARQDAVDEQIEIEREHTQKLSQEFDKRSRDFEVKEEDRVDVVKDVSEQLLEVEEEVSEKRAELISEAMAEAETASAEQREEILDELKEELLDLEKELAEDREEIVEKGLEELQKLEEKRAEDVKKELEKIAEAEKELAEDRKELIEEVAEAARNAAAEARELFDQALGDGLKQGDLFQAPELGDTSGEIAKLQAELETLEFKAVLDQSDFQRMDELRDKIAALKSGAGQARESFREMSESIAADSDTLSDRLANLINTEDFRTAFQQLSEADQEWAIGAIRSFQEVAAAGNANVQVAQELESVLESIGLIGPRGVTDLATALENLQRPTDATQGLQELAEKAQTLAQRAEEAQAPLQKIADSATQITQDAPGAAEGMEGMLRTLSDNQEGTEAGAESLGAISESVLEMAEPVAALAEQFPLIVEALIAAGEEEGFQQATSSLGELSDKVQESSDAFETFAEALGKLQEVSESATEIERLAEALKDVADPEIVKAFTELAKKAKETLTALEKIPKAADEAASAMEELQKALDAVVRFMVDELLPKLDDVDTAIKTIGTTLADQERDWQLWMVNAENSVLAVDELLVNLIQRIRQVGEELVALQSQAATIF